MTVDELKNLLMARGLRPDALSFYGRILTAAEQYVMEKEGSMWAVYYYERGNKNDLRLFVDEAGACSYLLSILEADKTVWTKVTSRR
jgi:hypothetical protein